MLFKERVNESSELMHGKTIRRLRYSDITEYRTFPDNFILTPNKTDFEQLRFHKPPVEYSRTYPILKVAKQTTTGKSRWRLDSIPNLDRLPQQTLLPPLRKLPSREDTFDTDFMMPSRVREVLESEGLEHRVINGVIGPAERKYQEAQRKINNPETSAQQKEKRQRGPILLPPVITTKKPDPRPPGPGPLPNNNPSWLDLTRQQPVMEPRRRELWENPPTPATRDAYLAWNYGENLRQPEHEFQVELDQKKFRAAQHVEQMHTGDNFRPPRVVLISSKIPKCHLLTKIYKDDVIPVLYDFDSNTFTELLDAITRRLDEFKKNCKARSIMVLCQGGPGYIYLLRNYAVTPQKLHKPSYRPVVGFWRAMAGLISKLSPLESAIHIFGFNLVGNEQGKQLVLMLQSLMYPNLVRVEPVTEETDKGRDIVNQYFNYGRYKILSKDAHTTKEVDFQKEGIGQVKRFHGPPMLRVAR